MSSSADIDTALAIRKAQESDVGDICRIYNHYVINSVVTFDTAEQGHEDRLRWLKAHEQENLPVIVAVLKGVTVGWASLSYYHSRCAYRTTVEFSIYLSPDATGKGIGRRLLAELIALGRSRGYHCIVGLICSENEISIRMSHAFGFETVGELREVGRKFDRWLNVTFVQKILSSE